MVFFRACTANKCQKKGRRSVGGETEGGGEGGRAGGRERGREGGREGDGGRAREGESERATRMHLVQISLYQSDAFASVLSF
jgi:hypothetical protein